MVDAQNGQHVMLAGFSSEHARSPDRQFSNLLDPLVTDVEVEVCVKVAIGILQLGFDTVEQLGGSGVSMVFPAQRSQYDELPVSRRLRLYRFPA